MKALGGGQASHGVGSAAIIDVDGRDLLLEWPRPARLQVDVYGGDQQRGEMVTEGSRGTACLDPLSIEMMIKRSAAHSGGRRHWRDPMPGGRPNYVAGC